MRTEREHAVGEIIEGPWNRPAPTAADKSERELLAKEIADQIVAGHGSGVRWAVDIADVERWRALARQAGRIMSVTVRTGMSDDGSKVWVVDES